MAEYKPVVGPQDAPGFFESLTHYLGSASGYFSARMQLFGLEAKEAAGNYLKLLVLVVTALLFLVFGLIFGVIFLVFLVQRLTHWDWIYIVLGFTVLNFAAAVGCLLLGLGRLKAKVLEQTIAEFKKDKQWLTSKPTPSSASAS